MTVKWKDDTSYSQTDTHPRTPRCWRADLPGVVFKVHRYHGCIGWFLSCRSFEIDTRALTPEDIDQAKTQALAIIQIELERRAKQYHQAIETICETRKATP